MRSPGRSLDPAARAFMEPRFGHDFSNVRVHDDVRSNESAQAVNALAYTVNRDIVFNRGQYAPETATGKQLLAHELSHVIQQESHLQSAPTTLEYSNPGDRLEQEASRTADAAMNSQPIATQSTGEPAVARQMVGPLGPLITILASCANPGQARSVDLQPVFFKSSAADKNPTGGTWSNRFSTSNTIWGKLGVTFNALSAVTLEDATNKTAGGSLAERNTIRGLRSGDGIEVFMVDNDLADAGGGATTGSGSSAAKVVLADRGTSNTLLAHELGHVLGLGHPPGDADANTIMTPSSSHSAANPTRNTMDNYSRITWPAGSGSVCLNPDT